MSECAHLVSVTLTHKPEHKCKTKQLIIMMQKDRRYRSTMRSTTGMAARKLTIEYLYGSLVMFERGSRYIVVLGLGPEVYCLDK